MIKSYDYDYNLPSDEYYDAECFKWVAFLVNVWHLLRLVQTIKEEN